MPTPLYLDSARLGPMSPLAQRLLSDFGRLTAEDPASPYIEDFLRRGFGTLPEEYRVRFGDLAAWTGLADLKASLRRFVGASDDSRVLIAGRSRSLMRLAARCLFQQCRNVLTTDLSWPAYQTILEDEAHRTGHGVTQVRVRQRLFRQETCLDNLAAELDTAARHYRCDGLFLPVVDNLGIRLPVADIVAAIRQRTDLKFIVLDAAQAIGHVPLSSDLECSDFVIAGTHKWLGGYLPLGLAFLNSERTRKRIIETSRDMRAGENLDDPLFDFLTDLEAGSLGQHSETINFTPLLTCRGALHEFDDVNSGIDDSLRHQRSNAEVVRVLAEATGWTLLLPAADQRTGIVLLQSGQPECRSLSADALRRRMQQSGITATAYESGIVRLSMPRSELRPSDVHALHSALQRLATPVVHELTPSGDLPAKCVSSAAC